MTRTYKLAAIAVATALAAPASAAEIFFGEELNPAQTVTGAPVAARAAFLARLVGASTEDFSGFTNNSTPTTLTFEGSAGAINATLVGEAVIRSTNTNGRFATSPTNFLRTQTSFSTLFDTPVAAFGFFGTDFADLEGQVTISLLRAGGGVETFIVPATNDSPSGSLIFFGLVDQANPFNGFSFASNLTTDNFGIDDLTIGDVAQVTSAVPEPGTWATMLLGFGAIGASLRTRRRQVVPA